MVSAGQVIRGDSASMTSTKMVQDAERLDASVAVQTIVVLPTGSEVLSKVEVPVMLFETVTPGQLSQ